MTEQEFLAELDLLVEDMSGDNEARIARLEEIVAESRERNYDHVLISALYWLLWCWGDSKGYDGKSMELAQEGVQISQQLFLEDYEAHFLNLLGIQFKHNQKFQEAQGYFETSLAIYRKLELPDLIATELLNLAQLALSTGQSAALGTYHSEISEILPRVTMTQTRAACLIRIGCALHEDFDHNNALSHFHEALKLSEDAGDVRMSISSRKWAGLCYLELGDFSHALETWNQAEHLCDQNHIWLEKVDVVRGYARLFIKQGQPDAAREQIERALVLVESFPETYRQAVKLEFVHLYAELGDSDRAIRIVEEALIYFEQINDIGRIRSAYKSAVEAYISAGNHLKALEYHNLLRRSERKFYDEQYRNGLKFAESKLELEREKSEKQIQTLRAEGLERSLTQQALTLASQSDLLATFRDDLRRILRKIEIRDPAVSELHSWLKKLPEAANWREFEVQFQKVHPKFKDNLARQFPALTEIELKVCALTRLNLKALDLGKLLSFSERTVQNQRYRIRKKLGIGPADDLVKFLQAF